MVQFKKGYADDIGVDICLDYRVTFEPFETKVIDVGVTIPTDIERAIMMCARTSAARQGLIVNQCPIDPNYTGTIHIIAHNCSNSKLVFEAGIAFAQLYAFETIHINIPTTIKNLGKRDNRAFGSSDGGNQ